VLPVEGRRRRLESGGDFAADGGRRVGEQVEQEEGRDRTQVEAEDGRDDPPEQVQERIGDCVQWTQSRDALRLGEPAQQDPPRDEEVVDR